MDQFIYLLEFCIIVYKECKYAVLLSHIDAYFATKLHKLGLKERQRIAKEVAEVNGLTRNEETLRRSEFIFPSAASQPIAALGKPEENGLQCTTCQYICCTIRGMRIHQREEHNWKSKQKGGQPKKKANNQGNQVL
jgi:hypothetical protein